ncbi:cytochrome P450 [Tothia fuscella]|uniref:Cytochrome P450 n=1 Tax=Tothia fuscella TaxID=1048955 RepID=A0A9P4TU21_9PEZI|nr:cytochrome P450 [Tothia fuscella]
MSQSLNLPYVALAVCIALSIYRFLVYPLFLSPLSRIPSAHPLAKFTSLWILYIRYRNLENSTIHKAHQKWGPVIQLGPNELSVNCVKDGILTVYSGGFEKGDWYNLFANYEGVRNMFSMPLSKQHSSRKRMLSNIYSKSHLQSSPTMSSISSNLIFDRFLPELNSKGDTPFNIYALFSAIAMDFVCAYLFGLESGSNLTQDEEFRTWFLDLYDSRRSYNFWPQELPRLTSALASIGINLTPKWVNDANKEIEEWTLSMVDKSAAVLEKTQAQKAEALNEADIGNFPTVYSQLLSASAKAAGKDGPSDHNRERLEIASELLDHLAAGFDTTGITLTYLIHELSQRPDLQSSLRQELLTLSPQITQSNNPHLPLPKSLDTLPLLNAIIEETLRLRAAIPGPQPRITPPGGCTLGPQGEYPNIPSGIRISALAHSLHRNANVFTNPEQWLPERYLTSSDEQLKEMRRWFWAFGSGGRMCVGSKLALLEIKYVVAALYTNFRTVVVDDGGIEQMDIYTAPPRGGKLIVRLERVED